MKKTLLTGLAMIWATSTSAHSPLETTLPANGATLTEAPREIILNFTGSIRLTRLTLIHTEHETDLDLDGYSGFVSDYTIPMHSVGAGTYQVEWRGLGNDGHPMNGTFSFTVEK
ncbi:copper resistance CopC family protein [Roseovarius sp. EL26]|uniref:copper resistance CopC family protein n=1 Tax=Roseovarius sp. EL26 TaxID=2126672 RepID=UPI000EA364F2|nr:copper resistance CopC family protein [Roseovarius sp. EL26]